MIVLRPNYCPSILSTDERRWKREELDRLRFSSRRGHQRVNTERTDDELVYSDVGRAEASNKATPKVNILTTSAYSWTY